MITPQEVRDKIAKHYERWYRKWAGELFCEAAGLELGSDYIESVDGSHTCTIALHPPTEKSVLDDIAATKTWVDSWRNDRLAPFIQWTKRHWKSVGSQQVPEKIRLPDILSIAQCASREKAWNQLAKRTEILAERWRDRWQQSAGACALVDSLSVARALEKCAAKYVVLPESDWERLVATFDWLMDNPYSRCYVRQLPIKGIDSKWLETHRGAIEPFYTAITGKSAFSFARIERQIRVRFLDTSIAPGGMRDISASPEELSKLTIMPRLAIVVENLTSLCCLPDIPGIVAFHGGGYAVDSLSRITWLLTIPIVYWGDLDSNGFAILNRFRHHHPRVSSIMMDKETLRLHKELCGEEKSPNYGSFECLTSDERETLGILLSGENALRLEQERIEWSYALNRIEQAIKKTAS